MLRLVEVSSCVSGLQPVVLIMADLDEQKHFVKSKRAGRIANKWLQLPRSIAVYCSRELQCFSAQPFMQEV